MLHVVCSMSVELMSCVRLRCVKSRSGLLLRPTSCGVHNWGTGVSAAALNGMSYAEAAQQAEAASAAWRPRASVVEDLLDNGGLTFHPIRSEE